MNTLRGSSSSLLLSFSTHHLHLRPWKTLLLPTFTFTTTRQRCFLRSRTSPLTQPPPPPPPQSPYLLANKRCFCNSTNETATETAANEVDMSKIKEAANTLELRVGRILKAWRHEEADSLYVEEVDLGEAEPRTICSGLVKYIPLEHLQDTKVVVLANLKPRNMRGVKSYGMLMAASDESHENVELLMPPEGAVPGERIWFGSADDKESLPDPASPNQIQKKKIWELVQPHLRTDDSCAALLGVEYMQTSAGPIVCKSLKNARIS